MKCGSVNNIKMKGKFIVATEKVKKKRRKAKKKYKSEEGKECKGENGLLACKYDRMENL